MSNFTLISAGEHVVMKTKPGFHRVVVEGAKQQSFLFDAAQCFCHVSNNIIFPHRVQFRI